MTKILIIAKKEISTFFDSLIAYMIIAVFLAITGYNVWLTQFNVFAIGQTTLRMLFEISIWTFMGFIPALTMKMIAEEKKTGTIELLLTKAVTDWEVVVGKFMACLALVLVALFCTLPTYYSVAQLGEMDHAATIGGYLGLLFASGAFIALGLFASSITNNQIVAFLVGIVFNLLLLWIFTALSGFLSGSIGNFFNYMSIGNRFASIARGVIDLKDLIYFLSLILGFLFFTTLVLNKRKTNA